MASDKQMLSKVAQLYYEDNMTQAQIAAHLGISRPKVSRLLTEAKSKGIVKIFVDKEDDNRLLDTEIRIQSSFNLTGVKIASVPADDNDLSVRITTRLAAQYLSSYIRDGDRIGVAWGYTMYQMCKQFPEMELEETIICQVLGNVDNAMGHSYANEIIGVLSSKLQAKAAYNLTCPAMVDNRIILDTLLHDIKIKELLNLGQSCNKLFVNIALPDERTCLARAGYLKESDLQRLNENKAVGSICCRFFDKEGQVCDSGLDERTIGITIDDIRAAECVMACVVDADKAYATYCALKSGFIDVLVVDSVTASAIIGFMDS